MNCLHDYSICPLDGEWSNEVILHPILVHRPGMFVLDLLVVWISWKVVFYLSFEGCYFQNLVDLKAFQIQTFGWSLCILLEKHFFNISFCKIQKPCFSLDGALNKLKGHFFYMFLKEYQFPEPVA